MKRKKKTSINRELNRLLWKIRLHKLMKFLHLKKKDDLTDYLVLGRAGTGRTLYKYEEAYIAAAFKQQQKKNSDDSSDLEI